MSRSIFVYALFGVVGAWGCARGGEGTTDAPPHVDAPSSTKQDAAVSTMMDSGMPHQDASNPTPDAAVIIDAPPGSVFCTTNSQCTVSGECCVNLGGPQGFCAPGTIILGQCFPQ